MKSVENLCLMKCRKSEMNPEKDLKSGLPPQSSTAGSPQEHPGELWCVDGFGTGEALEKIHLVELVSWRGGLRIRRKRVKVNLYKKRSNYMDIEMWSKTLCGASG